MELDLDVIRGRVQFIYPAADPGEVYQILQENLDDFRMFVADVQRIVAKQQNVGEEET
jgi:uncharacterized protein YutE (UPF0331/DUF86 family)